jgi:hypothetical protein
MEQKKRSFKTKKVLSGMKSEYRAWKEWEEGDVLVCKLLGSSKNKKNPTKNDWLVEVIEPFFADKAEMKRLKKGTRLTLNSAGQLDKGMEQIETGSLVQITYNGAQAMKGGSYKGQMAHTMEVIEVEEDNGDEDEEDYEADEEQEDDFEDEDDDL